MDDAIKAAYEKRLPVLTQLKEGLEQGLRDALESVPHVDNTSCRVKGKDSFARKAVSGRYSVPLREIEDQVACRVLVFFLSDLDPVSAALQDRWNTVEYVQKRPNRDAEFGYESRHHVFIIPEHLKPAKWELLADMPTTFEVQVRTLFMHAYAEPQHDLGYKGREDLPKEELRRLSWIAASAWGADQAFEQVRQSLGE